MKKTLILLCCLLFINLSFVSCGDDEEDEVFITNEDQGKEMIKGKWIVESIKMESNYPSFDKSMNFSLLQSLQENILMMTFNNEYVTSTTVSKKDQSLSINSREKYFFQGNKLYIEDIIIKMTLECSYMISAKTLVMNQIFSRDIFIKTIETEGIINGIDSSNIIASIPYDFSGKLIYTAKK